MEAGGRYQLLVSSTAQPLSSLLNSNGLSGLESAAFKVLIGKATLSDGSFVVRRVSDGSLQCGSPARELLDLPLGGELDADAAASLGLEIFVLNTSSSDSVAEGDRIVVDLGALKRERESDTTNLPSKARRTSSSDAPSSASGRLSNAFSSWSGAVPPSPDLDVLLSFDLSSRVFPCVAAVREGASSLVSRLFASLPGLRVGALVHGDSADSINMLDLVDRAGAASLVSFLRTAPQNAGPAALCRTVYNNVLTRARSATWSSSNRVLVVVGDGAPDRADDTWRVAAADLGARIVAVQLLDQSTFAWFWRELAEHGGAHVSLSQYAHVADVLAGACYGAARGAGDLRTWASHVRSEGRMTRSLAASLDALAGGDHVDVLSHVDASSPIRSDSLQVAPPWRYQLLRVADRVSVARMAERFGVAVEGRRMFYEVAKPAKCPDGDVVVVDRRTGDAIDGAQATAIVRAKGKVDHSVLATWRVFAQCATPTRDLVPDTGFLFEVSAAELE